MGERNERVRAYYCADFEPENREFAYAAWDANDQVGASFGHTLIDSGASRHSLGRLSMACAINVRSIEPPLIMETANGDLAITLEGDVELADGTIVRDWLLNNRGVLTIEFRRIRGPNEFRTIFSISHLLSTKGGSL